MSTERTEYIAGLRALADSLEQNENMPLPSYGANEWQPIRWVVGDNKEAAQQVVRGIRGTWRKETDYTPDHLLTFVGHVRGLHLDILVEREAVCERVVTGTREVTKTIPVETEEITVTEEVVEWVCKPLLAEAVQ